jgi:hypothetical protein
MNEFTTRVCAHAHLICTDVCVYTCACVCIRVRVYACMYLILFSHWLMFFIWYSAVPSYASKTRMHSHVSHVKSTLSVNPHLGIKLIAFELAGEDRDRRETPVLSRLKIAVFALHKRG